MVGQDGLAAGAGEGVDRAVGGQIFGARRGVIGEEEDTAGTGPELTEGVFCLKDMGGVGPEAAVPEAVDAAVDQVDLLAGVEDQRGAGGEFSVDDDEVAGSWLMARARSFEPRIG